MTAPRRLRAPQQDGAVLAEPPLSRVGELLSDNQRRLNKPAFTVLGRSFVDLRRQARQSAIDAASEYMGAAGEPPPPTSSPPHPFTSSPLQAPLFMAGHQPELFHPGVWAKNFALHGLARAHSGIAINLVVDNDTAKSTALRVPTARTDEIPLPHALTVLYDQWVGEVPYEEREVADEDVFAHFADRVAEVMRGWKFTPLVRPFWEEVRRQARRTRLLGERLAVGRRSIERAWGAHNLEVPVSRLCQTEPFAWFVCHVLTDLPRFHAVYNAAVHDYRQRYGLRSRNHPVPDLASEGDWLETPFWAWRAGRVSDRSTRRGRLLARRVGEKIELRAGSETWPTLPVRNAVEHWQKLEAQGFKVRSRALTNTLYARLFVADLFVHGIGGAKYDELTDEITRRFYGIEPPEFLALSATRLLPVPRYPVGPDDVHGLARRVRDLDCNPQRYLSADVETARALVAEKQAWIARRPADGRQRRERFEKLRQLTQDLRPYLEGPLREAQHELIEADKQLAANAALSRRDYAFCLYPEETLRPFVTQFA